jgi:hypothetical protein
MCEFYTFSTHKSDFRLRPHTVHVSRSVTVVMLCFFMAVCPSSVFELSQLIFLRSVWGVCNCYRRHRIVPISSRHARRHYGAGHSQHTLWTLVYLHWDMKYAAFSFSFLCKKSPPLVHSLYQCVMYLRHFIIYWCCLMWCVCFVCW